MISCARPHGQGPFLVIVLGSRSKVIYLLFSWQAWLCGGSVEILPCSRVGHVYRNQEARSPLEQEAILRNKVLIAETWLGSFKEVFYRHNPEAFTLNKVKREIGGGFVPHVGSPAGSSVRQEFLPTWRKKWKLLA